MEGYTVRRFVNDKEVRELTPEQKKMMALTVIRAIGAKEKKQPGEIPGRKDKHKMGRMQEELLRKIELSMKLKEMGADPISAITLQDACVEAAKM